MDSGARPPTIRRRYGVSHVTENSRMKTIVALQRFRAVTGGPGSIQASLGEHGYSVRPFWEAALDPHEIVLALGNVGWFPREWPRLLSLPPVMRPRVILWHTEPLPFSRSSGLRLQRRHLRELAKIALRDLRATDPQTNWHKLRSLLEHGLPDLLVVSTPEKKEFLDEQGIEAEFVPLGYSPWHGRDLGIERDIDVLFLGALDVPRRKRLVRRLRRAGIDVRAAGSWTDPAFWGEPRTELLNRTKILLNLPRHPGLLSGQRMILGMANKALVISEPVHLSGPYEPGVHYVNASPDEMPEAIRRFLADDDARTRITETAYRLVTEELTTERSVARIVELAEARFG